MKMYSVIAKRGKLKYYEEHIDFTLDGTQDYNWRKINKQKKNGEQLSLPKELIFTPENAIFNKLNSYDWLKSSFALPILNNKFIDILKDNLLQEFEVFPITIQNENNEVNKNFSAFYLKEYLDCLDKENSKLTITPTYECYDAENCTFKKNIEYPIFFKIKDISTPFKHFITNQGIEYLKNQEIIGIDTSEIKRA